MKSDIDLLKMYKEEKALIIGMPDVRTGLEPFPSFQEWKRQYTQEYNATHVTVSIEEADAQFDAAVEEADLELQNLMASVLTNINEEDSNMSENVQANTEEAVNPNVVTVDANEDNGQQEATTEAQTKPEATKKAPKVRLKPKAKGNAKAKATSGVKKRKSRAKSKTEKARTIFNQFYGKKTRAEIVEKFVRRVGLTANGASTYYQKFKKEVE